MRARDIWHAKAGVIAVGGVLALSALLFGATTTTAFADLLPRVESESVSHVTSTDATLEATIEPGGYQAGVYYQFQIVENASEYPPEIVCPERGLPPGHDTCGPVPLPRGGMPIGFIAGGSPSQSVSQDLAAAGVTLKPGTTYHYRMLVVKRVITEDTLDWEGPLIFGSDQTFTPPPPPGGPPVIGSVSVSHLTPSDATLEAQINSEGESTLYEFLMWYTPCAMCEDIAIFKINLPSGLLLPSFQDQSVSLDLNSVGVTLAQGAEYGYSLRATNAAGGTEAQWKAFQPPVLDPPGSTNPPGTNSPGSTVTPGPIGDEPEVPLDGGQTAGPGAPSSSGRSARPTAGRPPRHGAKARQQRRKRKNRHEHGESLKQKRHKT